MKSYKIDLKKELGNSYNELLKLGFIKEVEEIVNNSGIINIDIEDIKEVLNSELVGVLVVSTNDLDIDYKLNRVSDKKPTKCLLNLASKEDVKLTDIQKLVDNLKNTFNPDLNVIFGTNKIKELKDNYKIQAIFSV